jgi:SAM-dependent methyltransferase
MLRDAYLQLDAGDSLLRFRVSGEFQETLAELRHYHPAARSLVDVGGGAGVMAVAFALAGYQVTLIEPSVSPVTGVPAATRLIDYTERKIDDTIRSRIHVLQGWIEDVVPEQRFDIAYCRQAVHHFSDPVAGLRKIRSMVATGGLAFLSREHVIFDEQDRQAFYDSHPFQRYTSGEAAYRPEEYVRFLQDAGFTLLRQYRFAETLINCFPHDPDYARAVDERAVAGRPYSFMARAAGDSA